MPESFSPPMQKRCIKIEMKKFLQPALILVLLASSTWPVYQALSAHQRGSTDLVTKGTWANHAYDLLYELAFSSARQPDGPLVVYRASSADLHAPVAVFAVQRDAGGSVSTNTPLLFPSPDGRYLALQTPLSAGYATNLQGAELGVLSTDGLTRKMLVPGGVALVDQPVWSRDGTSLYYHTGESKGGAQSVLLSTTPVRHKRPLPFSGEEAIHRVDLNGRDTLLWQRPLDDTSLQLVGVDSHDHLILSMARPNAPVQLVEMDGPGQAPRVVATLPADLLPGNVLGMSPNGQAVLCQRVVQWQPLKTTQIQIALSKQNVSPVQPLFATGRFGNAFAPLARSADGAVLAMSRVTQTRADLAVQGVPGVPLRETLLTADARTGASQRLNLPVGGQLVQAFWSPHVPPRQVQAMPQASIQRMFATPGTSAQDHTNASVFQQDEWMLEAHANLLSDSPKLPTMCVGNCQQGLISPPHVSAAIMHGVAYAESNWHQFNTSDYQIRSEPIGSPVKSWDGGWGEYQQTWGMPPQCKSAGNCRKDYRKIQRDEAYNIGMGAQSLINAWNGTAGVDSSSDPNDPYKANDWFFAVWAYNGVHGNNPNDIPSTHYAHWYPGAPFRSIYEEYVWYYAAHAQFSANGWTANYPASLGTALLPPQRAFLHTSDNFVRCVTCTIPDWTDGSFDREWVGQGAPDATTAGAFQQAYSQVGGEDVLGLPVDSGDGAAVRRWGQGWAQNMAGSSALAGALMLGNGTSTVYWVSGGVWTRYSQDDKGPLGCHGYPTSALAAYQSAKLGTDSYVIQHFQQGSIIWDSTTSSIAQDSCQT